MQLPITTVLLCLPLFFSLHASDFPTDPKQIEMLGLQATTADNLPLAFVYYTKLLECNHSNSSTLYNCAYLLGKLNRNQEAIPYYQKSLAQGSSTTTLFGLSKAQLACGNFDEAWPSFECRFPDPKIYQQTFGYTALDMQNLAGKHILIRAEWGLGDMVQFIRYVQLLKNAGAYTIVQVFDALRPLLSRCDFIDQTISAGDAIPNNDVQIPLLSLPMLFKTNINTIPASIPYLTADPKLVASWQQKLSHDHNLKVGLCWHAKPIYLEDNLYTRRSIPLENFLSLASLQGCSFYSLQKEFGTDELKIVTDVLPIHDFDPEFDTTNGRFMDTAAVIKNLDIIISADTSIVHVAGALGATVWVLLPYSAEWRWLPGHPDYAQGSTTPWYPNTMRLFKQKTPGDWHAVIKEVKEALQELLNKQQ
ncbi:MAG: hypothetical protein NTX86_03145 [Candidatus Dependentiae bacterium]|nr:hypothetical protein [Candidatus Dependentiae bacterium]